MSRSFLNSGTLIVISSNAGLILTVEICSALYFLCVSPTKYIEPATIMGTPLFFPIHRMLLVQTQRGVRGEVCAERRIIFERCIIEYIQRGICGASFKFCWGEILRKEMDWGERDKTFFSAL